MLRSVSCWIIRATLVFGCGVAADTCYPPGGVAGIVVATVVVTCVVGGLTTATVWKYWWTPRKRKAQQKSESSHHQQRQQPQKSTSDFAFDNPYFKNQEGDDATGKYKSSLNKNSLRSSKQSENSTKGKKGRGGKNHFVFGGGGGKKQKALDDSCLAAVERTFVNLRGHDFTGLGFNICGNMRDGILVKDVLHRGPASESGLIKAGDKIINVTVSFTNIVYEDALTILSYASPYDVQLEIERTPDKSRSTPSTSKKLGSCSFNNSGQKLFHPLYRSQSIDDLTQIDKEACLGHGPRRSQSVGVAAHKLASHFKNSDSKLEDNKERTPMSLVLSTTGSLNEKMLANVMADGSVHHNKRGVLQWEKRFEDTLESDDSGKAGAQKQDGKDSNPLEIQRSENNSKHRDSRQYLDFPPTRRNLEARMVLDENDINDRSQTVAEVSTQADPNEESSTPRGAPRTPTSQNPSSGPPRNRMSRRGEEENDSDVSRDSLEVTHRGYQKRKKAPSSSSSLCEDNGSFANPRQSYAAGQTSEQGGQASEVQSKNVRGERIYANNKPARIHSSSLSSSEGEPPPLERRKAGYASRDSAQGSPKGTDPSMYGNLRDVQGKPQQTVVYRNVQKSAAPYGERQKLNSSEGQAQSYGCGSRIVINGVNEDVRIHSMQNSKSLNSPTGYSSQQQADGAESTNKSVPPHQQQQQKFSKKPLNPAGGMFTQINPFQMPPKQKHSGFKSRVYREESPPVSNGDFLSRHANLPDSVVIKQSQTGIQSSHGMNYHQQR